MKPTAAQSEYLIRSYQSYYQIPTVNKNVKKEDLIGFILRRMRPSGGQLSLAIEPWRAYYGVTSPAEPTPTIKDPTEADVMALNAVSIVALRDIATVYNAYYQVIKNFKDAKKAEKDIAMGAKMTVSDGRAVDKQPPFSAPLKAEKSAPSAPSAPMATPTAPEPESPKKAKALPAEIPAFEEEEFLSNIQAPTEEEQLEEVWRLHRERYEAKKAKKEAEEKAAKEIRDAKARAERAEADKIRLAEYARSNAAQVKNYEKTIAKYEKLRETGYEYEPPKGKTFTDVLPQLDAMWEKANSYWYDSTQRKGDDPKGRYYQKDDDWFLDKRSENDGKAIRAEAEALNFKPDKNLAFYNLGIIDYLRYGEEEEKEAYARKIELRYIGWLNLLAQLVNGEKPMYDEELIDGEIEGAKSMITHYSRPVR